LHDRPLRKVVVVNTADEGGGAEVMSMTMLDGFAALGIDAWLLVGDKKSDHPRVVPFFQSPFLNYQRHGRGRRLLTWRRGIERGLGLESFAHPYSDLIPELTGSSPDLVLCHNLHGGYFDLRAIVPLSRRLPVVLRLFDSWLFTGHCAYPLQCPRWQTGCGQCPDLARPPAIERDATRHNWRRKRRILSGGRFFASAESAWMIERGRRSLLAPAVLDWKMVRGGVDLATFAPGSRAEARHALGLDPDASIALHVSNLGSDNPIKDFATIRRALQEIARWEPARRLVLLVVGAAGADERFSENITLHHLGYERSRQRLAQFYRAADIYVHAAIEEAYGLAVAEALACGTPVITASTGGVLEIIQDGRTGLVVPVADASKLAEAIVALLDAPERRAAMGRAAAAFARTQLDRRDMIAALHAWCEQIYRSWHAPEATATS
jgi:glycosyltransferase involved in cell wall biosynthesis